MKKTPQRVSIVMVEVRGLEPLASWSQTKRATNCATLEKHCADNDTLKRWQFQYLAPILACQVLAVICNNTVRIFIWGHAPPYNSENMDK